MGVLGSSCHSPKFPGQSSHGAVQADLTRPPFTPVVGTWLAALFSLAGWWDLPIPGSLTPFTLASPFLAQIMPRPPPQAVKSRTETLTPNGYFHPHNREQSSIYHEAFSRDGFLVKWMRLTISQKPKQLKNEWVTLNFALRSHLTHHVGGVKNGPQNRRETPGKECLSTVHFPYSITVTFTCFPNPSAPKLLAQGDTKYSFLQPGIPCKYLQTK